MKIFKVGIIGCGHIFPMHIISVLKQKNTELVAVCDNKEDVAKQAGEKFCCKYYTDYIEILEKEELECAHNLINVDDCAERIIKYKTVLMLVFML